MNQDIYKKNLKELKNLSGIELYGKDLLLTWEKTTDELRQILYIAEVLKYFRENNISARCFDSGLAVSQFRDKSTRTRFSFTSAANLLGLTVQELEEEKSQISHGETLRETVNMISFLTDIIGIRDDMYLGRGNTYMREVGQALDEGFEKGVLPQRPGIINLQCDIDHPTQTLADLLHLKNYFEDLGWLQTKKIAMTWAYSPSYGKPLSVPQGIIGLMTRFGMHVVLAHPKGYNLMPEVVAQAEENVTRCGGKFEIVDSMDEAFENADIVYPKSWAPYSIMQQRTLLLQNNDQAGLLKLEQECLAQNAHFKDWTCNEEKMKKTRNGEALYLHCLPADISGVSCREGEVSAGVFEKYRSDTYREAGYKPYIIASLILNNRFPNVLKIIHALEKQNKKRIL
jgi:knotted carbamoyltransferase YgeW